MKGFPSHNKVPHKGGSSSQLPGCCRGVSHAICVRRHRPYVFFTSSADISFLHCLVTHYGVRQLKRPKFFGIFVGLRCLFYSQDLRESREFPLASSKGEVGSRMPSHSRHPGGRFHFRTTGPPISNLSFFRPLAYQAWTWQFFDKIWLFFVGYVW